MTTFHATMATDMGEMLLECDGTALAGLYFVGQKDCPPLEGLPGPAPDARDPRSGLIDGRPIAALRMGRRAGPELFTEARSCAALAGPGPLALRQAETPAQAVRILEQTRQELAEYFSGSRRHFDVPLRLNGTAFQRRVWEALLRIPYGEVASYGTVAESAGFPAGHARAAGMAVGRNPLTIIVPCHRVLARNGRLNGYTGGLARKLALLRLEGLDPLSDGSYPAS